MIVVSFTSHKKGEKQTGKKAYLALLADVGGDIRRSFIDPTKRNNRQYFRTEATPGQIFEARRWLWSFGAYHGGTCWFAIKHDGTGYPLNYAEAVAALRARLVSAPPMELSSPALYYPTRLMPDDIHISRVTDTATPELEGLLSHES
jgi:hypothetical protein